jgi:site-specific recombinase XerD
MKNGLNKQETHFLNDDVDSIPALSTLQTPKLASKEAFFVLEKKPVPKSVPIRKRFTMDIKPYKLPVIIRPKSGDWFVRFWYELPDRPGKFKAFHVRDGINRIHDPIEKEKAIAELCKDVKFWLEKKDYNPFDKENQIKEKVTTIRAKVGELNKKMLLSESLTWFLGQKAEKGKSDKTTRGYEYHLKPFVEWCAKKELLRIDEPTIDHIENYLSERLKLGWTARTYNNVTNTLTGFFNYLVAKRKLAVTPIGTGMIDRIKNTAEKNRYYEPAIRELIMPEVKKKPQLRRFILWTYYSCARGSELRALKIKNVDLKLKKITITAESGKTGEYVGARSIPICNELMDILKEEKLKDLNPDWYVFGRTGEPSAKPLSHELMSRHYLAIKDKLKIDRNYTIYSWKHTRVCDLLVAGFEPIKVMRITGHTDYASFEKYTRELGVVMDKTLTGDTLTLNI